MKKIITLILAAVMLLTVMSFTACNETGTPGGDTTPSGGETPTGPVEFETVNETVYATQKVNIRSGMSVENNDNVVGQLDVGEEITRVGYHSEWSKVMYEGEYCYIKSAYLTKDSGEIEPPTTAVEDDKFTVVDNEKMYIYYEDSEGNPLSSGKVNLRDVPNLSESVTAVLDIGTEVVRVAVYYENEAEGTGWSKIIYNEKTYYIRNSGLSTTNYAEADTTTAA